MVAWLCQALLLYVLGYALLHYALLGLLCVLMLAYSSLLSHAPQWFPSLVETLPTLAGKTIAVTGCTSGTGFVLARTAVELGAARVVLLKRSRTSILVRYPMDPGHGVRMVAEGSRLSRRKSPVALRN